MKIGASSYTWPWAVGREGYPPEKPIDAFGLLEKTRHHDLSVLQLADIPHLHKMKQSELEAISQIAVSNDIALETGTRGIDPDHLMTYLSIARTLGSTLVRTITQSLDDEAASRLKGVLPAYEEAGVYIALENHDEYSTHHLASFIDKIGSSFLGVCLDTVNSFAALETPDVVVKTLAPYAFNFHVKDFQIVRFGSELGFSIIGSPAGEGRLDIPWIIDYLKRAGREPNLILELWTPFSENLDQTIKREDEWAHRSIRYLKGILG
jgi:sugar phosphate isomerase/epimerase